MYHLAETLGKTVAEIGQISHEEFNGWLAYYQVKAKRNE